MRTAILSAAAAPAFADGYEIGERHVVRDEGKVAADARSVREEASELAAARRQERRAWWSGDWFGARRAEAREREESRELAAARRKLHEDVADLRHDRADFYEDLARHRRYWQDQD
jgi:hypothetical protein